MKTRKPFSSVIKINSLASQRKFVKPELAYGLAARIPKLYVVVPVGFPKSLVPHCPFEGIRSTLESFRSNNDYDYEYEISTVRAMHMRPGRDVVTQAANS